MDLVPEVLNASMNRNSVMLSASEPSPVPLVYARYFLNKYRGAASVARWNKNFRSTCDQRLLAELDNGRSVHGDSVTSEISAGADIDEHVRQKLNGRTRAVPNMKQIMQMQAEKVSHNLNENKKSAAIKSPSSFDKEDNYQIAQDIVLGLVECIGQNGGASPDGDHSLVASAVSAIVGNAGYAISKHLNFLGGNYQGVTSSYSLNLVRNTLNVHINSLCLLKEALGERFNRIFEISLAVEACSAVAPSLSPKTHDVHGNHTTEVPDFNVTALKIAAAVSAVVVGAIVHGIVSLEQMIIVLRLKDGLDIVHFLRSSMKNTKSVSMDYSTEVLVHWFKILVGDCKTVYDGLIADILGDSHVLAISRLQRTLPLGIVLPPAYSIFAMVLWRPYLLNHEDIQLYQSLLSAISDIIRHQPFRDICFRNIHLFYDHLAADVGDSEFAAMLELQSPDKHLEAMPFIPLRARHFLNALLDCKIPVIMWDNGIYASVSGDLEIIPENDVKSQEKHDEKLRERLIEILDDLQPAKFHWQWVELRLILDERSLTEKVIRNISFVKALTSLSPNAEGFALSDREKGFTEMILSRLLVRPDAAPLYAEVIHLLGKLQESFVMGIKWFLQGQDVLLGRKSVRQQLVTLAQREGLPLKAQFWKPWGWSKLVSYDSANKNSKRTFEVMSLEEREVTDSLIDARKTSKSDSQNSDRNSEGLGCIQKYITQNALAELMLPCIDRSSSEFRCVFAGDLIKQMAIISEHIKALAQNDMRQTISAPSGNEASLGKQSLRKGMRSGSPIMGKRAPVPKDLTPPPASALREAIWLRLQFIIRLLPIIIADSNMRKTLASSILGLLGTRVVYEDVDYLPLPPTCVSALKNESSLEPVLFDVPGESVFDRLLSVLHALLGDSRPSWLKTKPSSKPAIKSPWEFSAIGNEVTESLQSAFNSMELPGTIRRRIQAAFPNLPTSRFPSITCHPPLLSSSALSPLQSCTCTARPNQKFPLSWIPTNMSSICRTALPSHDPDVEIDAWTLLDDGTSCPSTTIGRNTVSGVTGGHANLKACSLLKGAVRVRRTDLTYIGTLDDDS